MFPLTEVFAEQHFSEESNNRAVRTMKWETAHIVKILHIELDHPASSIPASIFLWIFNPTVTGHG